jgi:hypothetical protein
MIDQQFIRLSPGDAKNAALGRDSEECRRLVQLYREERGIDIEAWEPSPSGASDGVQNWGLWLAILGGLGAVLSFFFPVGVETVGLYGLPGEVANLDKIALRHMCLAGSLGLFVGGCTLIGAGHVAKTIRLTANADRPS